MSNRLPKILSNLKKQQEEGMFTDIIIAVPGNHDIKAHKNVLAAASPFFEAMFKSGMRESSSNRVEMRKISYEAAQFLIESAYSDDYQITSENAQTLLEAADCYQFQAVKESCESFLLNAIEPSNCFELKKIAEDRSLPRLSAAASSFALENFISIKCLNELPFSVLKSYLADDELNVAFEVSVYVAIISWLQHDRENRSQYASKLLKCVRLGIMCPRLVKNHILGEPLFADVESQQYILRAISGPYSKFDDIWRPRKSSITAIVDGDVNSRISFLMS